MGKDRLLLVIAFCVGGAVGSLLTYLSRTPDQVAIDAAIAGEECCLELRELQTEMDKADR